MKVFIFLIFISTECFGFDFFQTNPLNETPPLQLESPERNRQRAINMAQRAMFAYPEPRRIRKSIEGRLTGMVGKEFAATLGIFYTGINNQEISSRYIRNLTFPLGGGSIRPDVGLQIRQKNSYFGLFYLRSFP
jgi:hypothetical protein